MKWDLFNLTIYGVRLSPLIKPLWDVFAVSRELVSRVNVVRGMIHLTLKERATFGRMNHTPVSMDDIDQVTIDYSRSLGKW